MDQEGAEPQQEKVACLFPGQGAQWVGMGRGICESSEPARRVFEQADDVLGFSLSRLCFEGPEETLRQTINAQPAIFTFCVACYQSLQPDKTYNKMPAFFAGHSLGEYTALAAAGGLDFADALRLVRERGRLMQYAGEKMPGGMVAIIGLDSHFLEEVCQKSGAEIANINCPGQIVLSGSLEALQRATELAKAKGARKLIPLEVSGAFHSRLMAPALDEMSEIICAVPFRRLTIPVVANTTANPLFSTGEVKAELIRQLCSCVRWQQSVEYLLNAGVTTFVEIGPKQVLSALIKRIDKNSQVINIGENPPE